jgi:hypothetical protein
MSAQSQGPGWWVASDGKWYPPETHPAAAPAEPQGEGWIAQDAEDGGHGKFGDGQSSPLYEFQASRLKGGRIFTPNVIRVWPDRVEEHEHHAVRKTGTQSISLHQISEVSMSRGIVWANVAVESTGGKSIVMVGMPKADADRVKQLLDSALVAIRAGAGASTPPMPVAAPDLADQLMKLAGLRDQGILTPEEFDIQKARLLG